MVLAAGAVGWGLANMTVPATLEEAGLQGRAWTAPEVDMARRVTAKELLRLAEQLDNASRLGDMSALMPIAVGVTSVFRSWSDQTSEITAAGHYCLLATSHISNGIDLVSQGAAWRRDQFQASLQACRP